MRTLLLSLLLLRLAMAIPFHKSVTMGFEVLRHVNGKSAIATHVVSDDEIQLAAP